MLGPLPLGRVPCSRKSYRCTGHWPGLFPVNCQLSTVDSTATQSSTTALKGSTEAEQFH